MHMFKASCGAIALACGTAMAGDVWVGNASGQIDRHRPLGTQTVFPTLCTQVAATVASGETLFLADSFGNIWKLGTKSLVTEFFPQSFISTSLAMHNGDLLAGSADGRIRRIRTSDGAVLSTMIIGGQIHALTVDGDTVYTGGHDTLIRRGNAVTGPFQVIGACGGQVHSVAVFGNELLASAIDNRVYRINKSTGQYITQWNLPAGMGSTQIVIDGSYLVAGGANGLLYWLNPTTGVQQFSTAICSQIRGVAIVQECRADVDRSGGLTANDFGAFINVWAAASPHADMDGSGGLTANDFQQYMNAYFNGCP